MEKDYLTELAELRNNCTKDTINLMRSLNLTKFNLKEHDYEPIAIIKEYSGVIELIRIVEIEILEWLEYDYRIKYNYYYKNGCNEYSCLACNIIDSGSISGILYIIKSNINN